MIKELKLIDSTRVFGPMSINRKFYSPKMTEEEIQKDFLERRRALGHLYGFDAQKIMIPKQKKRNNPDLYPDGHYVKVTSELLEDYEDYWYSAIPADIVLLEEPDIVVGYPAADCPILVMEDEKNQVVAVTHCGAEYLDRRLAMQEVDALEKEYGTKLSDIKTYISACASKNSYFYDCYPTWATDPMVWKNSIIEVKTNKFAIDLQQAIRNQLKERGLLENQLFFSPIDTITSPFHYSNNAAFHNDSMKNGRQLQGAVYVKR